VPRQATGRAPRTRLSRAYDRDEPDVEPVYLRP
jgi:hypothetical protein